MAKSVDFISHWHQLIESFQASSLAFYESVEAAVQTRAIPETKRIRVEHKEGGLASARREYLRLHRGKHAFDICAAPFGNGFFISWWFTEPPLKFGFLYTLAFIFAVFFAMGIAGGIGLAVGGAMIGFGFGVLLCASVVLFGVPALLWLLGYAMRQGSIGGESTVLAMPLIGWIYERIFAPETFYSMDTALMFRDAVHSAVLEVYDCITANKGIRALTETERKPVMKSLSTSA